MILLWCGKEVVPLTTINVANTIFAKKMSATCLLPYSHYIIISLQNGYSEYFYHFVLILIVQMGII